MKNLLELASCRSMQFFLFSKYVRWKESENTLKYKWIFKKACWKCFKAKQDYLLSSVN